MPVLRPLFVLVLLPLLAASGCLRAADRDEPGRWTTLRGCTLVEGAANDGDSFDVRHKGRQYRFRLYFADAPETNDHIKARVKEQAAYWDISQKRTLLLGEEASALTAGALAKPFTVVTRWQDARGAGHVERFFAFVKTGDGEDLAAALVSAGLARVHGAEADEPGGMTADERWKELEKLEKEAKKGKRGGWQKRARKK